MVSQTVSDRFKSGQALGREVSAFQIATKCPDFISVSSDTQGMWFHVAKQRGRFYLERRAPEYVEGLTNHIL